MVEKKLGTANQATNNSPQHGKENQFDFRREADKLIEEISSQIEASDKGSLIEIDYQNEVLNLEISDMIYVINKQSPKMEIWLASPVSGPHHFVCINSTWVNKNSDDIKQILASELSRLTNQHIDIK